jgi:hypothetical protein
VFDGKPLGIGAAVASTKAPPLAEVEPPSAAADFYVCPTELTSVPFPFGEVSLQQQQGGMTQVQVQRIRESGRINLRVGDRVTAVQGTATVSVGGGCRHEYCISRA